MGTGVRLSLPISFPIFHFHPFFHLFVNDNLHHLAKKYLEFVNEKEDVYFIAGSREWDGGVINIFRQGKNYSRSLLSKWTFLFVNKLAKSL